MSSQIWRILLLTTCFVPVAVVSAALDDDIRVIINVTGEDPGGLSWADSYSIGDSCYCSFSTFDHGLINFNVETPLGWMTLPELCQKLGPGPGMEGRPIYNDVQCGNGPPNDAGDEHTCPGRVDLGREGCGYIGPKWNFLPLIEQNSSSSPSSSPSSQSMSPSGEPSVAPNIEPTMSSPIDSGSFQEPPILINFGKSTAVNGYGVADQLGYLQGPVNDYGGGGETISMTSSAEAYASHSWSFEYLSYTITLDAQETYRVTLGFAESYTPNCEIGRRVFDVAVGSHTRNGVDVFEAAGCLTAYNVVFPEVQPLPSGTITINVTKTDRNNLSLPPWQSKGLVGFPRVKDSPQRHPPFLRRPVKNPRVPRLCLMRNRHQTCCRSFEFNSGHLTRLRLTIFPTLPQS